MREKNLSKQTAKVVAGTLNKMLKVDANLFGIQNYWILKLWKYMIQSILQMLEEKRQM